MFITASILSDAPEFRATLHTYGDDQEPRTHLALAPGLAIIVNPAELRQLAQVIEDAFQLAIQDGNNVD